MKIATNVQRDAFGGITISNLALFDWLSTRKDTIVGIEYTPTRRFKGPAVFRRYGPEFFSHHIVNGFDVMQSHPWDRVWTSRGLRRHWEPLLDATRAALHEERPDAVLVNGTYHASWLLATASHQLGIPYTLRYAGILKREAAHLPFLRRRNLLRFERDIVRNAAAVIFPSASCRSIVELEVTGSPIPRGTVVPNPVAPPRGLPRRRTAGRTIAAIGRWTPIKKFERFASLHERLQEDGWTHRAQLVTSSAPQGMPDTVEAVPPMSNEKLWKFYRSIDLLVITSSFETFCNVAAEAVVAGTPVLVSDAVGFSEILREAGLQRMIIPSFDDVDRAARMVKQLCGTTISRQEQRAVRSLLDPHVIHDRLIDILRSAA